MLAIERREEILRIIRSEKSVRVNKLANKFEVTEETIRRDLDKLDKEGMVKKTYGGAVLAEYVSKDNPLAERRKTNLKEKCQIATYADNIINDGETLFIDMSTTVLEFVKNISDTKNITVITNSLIAITELQNKSNISLITVGGSLDKDRLYMDGPMTTRFIQNYYVDKTFFSVKAISRDRGIMDSRERSAEIKRQMISNANQAILIVDQTKFDKTALTKVTEVSDVDIVITESDLSQEWLDSFDEWNVEVIQVK